MPAAAVDPLPRLRGLRRRGDHRDDLVPRRRLHQLQVQLRLAHAREMPVSLDEPGNRELTLEIDHFGGGTEVALDLRVRADGRDAIALYGNRLRFGRRR